MAQLEKEEVGTFVNALEEQIKKDIKEAINKAIQQKFDETYFILSDKGILRHAEMREVLFRSETIHLIIDGFSKKIGDEEYEKTLENIGISVGRSFADDLLKKCRKEGMIPRNYKVYTLLWAIFDTEVGWGKMRINQFSERGRRMEIAVENSWLVDEETKLHHRCPFMAGYIFGVLDEGFKRLYRWIDETKTFRIPEERLEVIEVNRRPVDNICLFEVKLGLEKLIKGYDAYFNAKREHRNEDYQKSILFSRCAIEIGLKEKLEIPITKYIPFMKLMNAMKRLKFENIDFKEIKENYELTSNLVHRMSPVDREISEKVIFAAQNFLSSLSRISIPKRKRGSIIEIIDQAPIKPKKLEKEILNLEISVKKDERGKIETKLKQLDLLENLLSLHETNLSELRIKEADYDKAEVPMKLRHNIELEEKEIEKTKKSIEKIKSDIMN